MAANATPTPFHSKDTRGWMRHMNRSDAYVCTLSFPGVKHADFDTYFKAVLAGVEIPKPSGAAGDLLLTAHLLYEIVSRRFKTRGVVGVLLFMYFGAAVPVTMYVPRVCCTQGCKTTTDLRQCSTCKYSTCARCEVPHKTDLVCQLAKDTHYKLQKAHLRCKAPICLWCVRSVATKRCGNCKATIYCSPKCQDADRQNHKAECHVKTSDTCGTKSTSQEQISTLPSRILSEPRRNAECAADTRTLP